MFELKLLLAVFIAIGIGWLLGKFPLAQYWLRFKNRAWHQSYIQGIHLLLDEESDQAIETFIQTWDVSSDNFDLHNALANMLRRKGEVDRAIRIHASLVECQKLTQEQIRQVTIELATDYIKAGLLDRAERLLINVVNNSRAFEERALELLQQIYQLEKEWDKAIIVAEQLAPKRSLAFGEATLSSGKQLVEIAQFYCELAQQALADDNFQAAEKALARALEVEPNCARASILQAEIALKKGQHDEVITIVRQLQHQDPHLLVEVLPLLKHCLADNQDALVDYLTETLALYPSVAIEKSVFHSLKKTDTIAASEFLTTQVQKRPTLQGLELLIHEQLELLQGAAKENLLLIHRLVTDVLANKPHYQCRSCGFSGNQMHWLCPRCHTWDAVRRIRGSEGD